MKLLHDHHPALLLTTASSTYCKENRQRWGNLHQRGTYERRGVVQVEVGDRLAADVDRVGRGGADVAGGRETHVRHGEAVRPPAVEVLPERVWKLGAIHSSAINRDRGSLGQRQTSPDFLGTQQQEVGF